MEPTRLTYLEDFTLLSAPATVVTVQEESNITVVIVDRTIFYPQGGGQPYDQGIIEHEKARFIVEQVRFVDGIVKHIGRFEFGVFHPGDCVTLQVNEERRVLNSRLHSAGHVVDMAITALQLPWRPAKGYHFPDGPYVEYVGTMSDSDKEDLKARIASLSNQFIAQQRATRLVFMDKEAMKEICHHVPDYLPAGKPHRVVLYGDYGVPCGGTHVSNLGSIGTLTVRKIKQEGANVRVSYTITL